MDYLQPKFYRFSEDSIWLADMAAKKCGGEPRTLLDVGAGCGVVGIETANRIPSIERLVLLEPQVEFLKYLDANQVLLRDGVKVEIVNRSIQDWNEDSTHDLVVSNPPYFKEGEGRTSPDPNRAVCRSFTGQDFHSFADGIFSRLSEAGEAFVLGHSSNPDVAKFLGSSGGRVQLAKRGDKVLILNFLNK